jgi:ferritin
VNKQDDDDDDDIQKLKRATAEREQDYSSMTSNEIYELIDDALDKRDFDRVKFLSKYLKESSNFEIMRYLKLFKNF